MIFALLFSFVFTPNVFSIAEVAAKVDPATNLKSFVEVNVCIQLETETEFWRNRHTGYFNLNLILCRRCHR